MYNSQEILKNYSSVSILGYNIDLGCYPLSNIRQRHGTAISLIKKWHKQRKHALTEEEITQHLTALKIIRKAPHPYATAILDPSAAATSSNTWSNGGGCTAKRRFAVSMQSPYQSSLSSSLKRNKKKKKKKNLLPPTPLLYHIWLLRHWHYNHLLLQPL